MSGEAIYAATQTSWIAGLLEGPMYRKNQLFALYQRIRNESGMLIETFEEELGWPRQVAVAAINVVMTAIEQVYPDVSLPDELSIIQKLEGGGSVERRNVSAGITLIVGCASNIFSSLLLPLVGALAVGSPSILVYPGKAPKVAKLIGKILRDAVDQEAFQMASESTLPYMARQWFDTAVTPSKPSSDPTIKELRSSNPRIRILNPPSGIVATLVDRTADLRSASFHLHNAMFNIKVDVLGESRPRLCLVDEFVLEQFAGHIEDRLSGRTARRSSGPAAEPANEAILLSNVGSEKLPTHAESSIANNARVIKSLLEDKSIDGNMVALIPTTSTDNAIDLLNAINGNIPSPVLYVFSASNEATFFARFAYAQTTYINAIPTSSLVTMLPRSSNATLSLPYSPADFAENRPISQFVPLRVSDSFPPATNVKPAILERVKRKEMNSLSLFELGISLGAIMALSTIGGVVYGSVKGVQLLLRG